VAMRLENLEKLTVRKTTDDAVFDVLGDGLQSNRMIKEIRLLENRFTMSNAPAIGRALTVNTYLTGISLFNSRFEGQSALQEIVEGIRLNQNLQSVNLAYCNLHDEDIALVVKALANHYGSITELNISGNYCHTSTMAAIFGLLQSKHLDLRKLVMCNQRVGNGTLDIAPLGPAWRKNTSLKHLDLSFNRLDDHDISNLMAGLGQNSSIEVLHLMTNNIKDEGVRTIAHHLPKMSALNNLSLSCNCFGEQGANCLATSLRDHMELENIALPIRFKCSDHIDFYIALNRAGRRLFKVHDITPALWAHVLSRANVLNRAHFSRRTRVDVIYHLLRGPALFDRPACQVVSV
jgi:hypothetical protein